MRRQNKNKGSAMMIAIIVSVVVIAFCLSLLLVCYSLYASSVRKISQSQCREVAKSVSLELEQEMTRPLFATYAEEQEALNGVTEGKSALWFYIRYNLFQQTWPFYDAQTNGHGKEDAWRYFDMELSNGDTEKYGVLASDITVAVYWEDAGDFLTDKEDALLCIAVTCRRGDQEATIRTYYALGVSEYDDMTPSSAGVDGSALAVVNPSGYEIVESERWSWSYQERY